MTDSIRILYCEEDRSIASETINAIVDEVDLCSMDYVSCGKEAIVKLSSGQYYSLILCNERLRSESFLKIHEFTVEKFLGKVPFLVLSSKYTSLDGIGNLYLIQKPYNVTELCDLIKRLL